MHPQARNMKQSGFISFLQKGILITTSVLLIAASGGFSYSVHFCHSERISFRVLPGLTGKADGCCCTVDMNRAQDFAERGKDEISTKSCCREQYQFLKLNELSSPSPVDQSAPASVMLFVKDMSVSCLPKAVQPCFETGYEPPPSILNGGKRMVLLYHQLRIPSPVSDC